MVFNKPGKLIKSNIFVKHGTCKTKVEDVESYKYLGVLCSLSGKYTMAKKDLLQRSYKAMFKLTSIFKDVKPNYCTSIHLFDHIIKPILLYGSDVWGDSCFCTRGSIYNRLKNDIIEMCHLKFCRYTLGVNRHAPTISIYGDTGRFPITYNAALGFMKYWYRLANINKSENSPLYNAYKENIEVCSNANSWASSVKYMLSLICGKGENVNIFNLKRSCNYFLNKFKSVFKNCLKKHGKKNYFQM